MARQPRFVLPGHPQHVIVRGNNREPIFYADEDYHNRGQTTVSMLFFYSSQSRKIALCQDGLALYYPIHLFI